MLDRHEAHDDRNLGQDLPQRDAAPVADRPVADREVPLPGMAAAEGPALVIHQWLDGETSEAEARRADAKQVDLWKMISTETEQRRRMTTPAYVAANIMAAIPEARTETKVATATATATSAMVEPKSSNMMLMVVGVAMLALGVVIGQSIGKMF
ncbi:hypothetical protein [Gemmatimonas groenlandica]|uniref:Uncharacterized protein n=1 Tax=Gemmatimonas groenlandica TaxID=2732249 RepID=A0A6M4IQM7_9BACT|nr:hypothetical protein [Gemmatimonas groenlandica]QJR36298.1 hypothetical protein HKW67_12685 [Gemmatimonas groenlandica]